MLPFTAETLFSDFGQYNRALWPLPALALALGVAAILLTILPVRWGDRAIAALLAAGWLWVGIRYHLMQFASLNFAAPVYGALFVLQGLLLIWSGVVRNRLSRRFHAGLCGGIGLGLAIAGVAWPLVDVLFGPSWQVAWPSARVAGLAPGPTVLLTFGLLLANGRASLHLTIIPLLWTLVAGATGWILGIRQDLVLPVAGLAGFGLILWQSRQPGAT